MENLAESLEQYNEKHKNHRWEGEHGLAQLEKLCEKLGYESSGFRFGSPIEQFLSDNPGAMEAILNWIGEQSIVDWQQALSE